MGALVGGGSAGRESPGYAANALIRGDPRTLIGLPIGLALITYLRSRRVRNHCSGETTPEVAMSAVST